MDKIIVLKKIILPPCVFLLMSYQLYSREQNLRQGLVSRWFILESDPREQEWEIGELTQER